MMHGRIVRNIVLLMPKDDIVENIFSGFFIFAEDYFERETSCY